jgi:hypothetical protein
MPAEGMVWLPKTEVLTFEEIERLARIVVEHFGVDGIRLTGGEPTMRAHLPVLPNLQRCQCPKILLHHLLVNLLILRSQLMVQRWRIVLMN